MKPTEHNKVKTCLHKPVKTPSCHQGFQGNLLMLQYTSHTSSKEINARSRVETAHPEDTLFYTEI